MAEIKQLFQVTSLPGIKRDGTVLDGDNYSDGQWVRFQRGRPKKMGGFQQISDQLRGPIRKTLVWSRETLNAVYSFSTQGIEMVLVDGNGLGSSIVDRTPASNFTPDDEIIWSVDTQYDDAVGSQGTVVLAHASHSMTNIDSATGFKPFLALANGNSAFTQIADAPAVSGGIFASPPYTIAHGSDGLVSWSDANQPQVWSTSTGNIGDAGADRVTGAKVVKGLPLRSGSGPAALLWSLDSVIRMDWVGGQAIFRFTHLSTQSSILAQNSVIEYDGAYFWMGVDRFLVCDGGKVNELPNQMNINWVFDNLNFEQRQKVWAMKIPRYGEIMWFFPFGDSVECNRCVIFNVREQVWYDNMLPRSSGFYSQVFKYPVMSDSEASEQKAVLDLSSITGTISVGDSIYGTVSGNTAKVTFIDGSLHYITMTSGDIADFQNTEGIQDSTSGATATIDTTSRLYQMYIHEKGHDAVIGENVSAIESYFTTADFGLPTGGAKQNDITGLNRWTRLIRIEPDFLLEGNMSVYVLGKEFANSDEKISEPYAFSDSTNKIDMREQRREIRLKFVSNEAGGHYEAGRIILHTEPGDVRS